MAALGYMIMRKNDPITYAEFTEDGIMTAFSNKITNMELAPIQDRYQITWLKEWWKERSVPIGQKNIQQILRSKGCTVPSEYLIRNLGLSLTDYYWIKPLGSDLTWEDVNLFDNPFADNLLEPDEAKNSKEDGMPHFSPNGSLQGQIEKTWSIRDGERYLIKGNRTNLSSESINEIIACEMHKRQGYSNYAPYRLVKIRHKEYDYGCMSRIFTSQKKELLPGFAVFTKEKKPNHVSNFDHFLNMAKSLGGNVDQIRAELEYQILTDFIMSGYDRHLNNIALIRDADNLKILGTAPIYDSGGSLFANKRIPTTEKELLAIKTNGFVSTELGLLSLVRDKELIDVSKLPPPSYIKEMYGMDSQMSEKDINNIAYWYERKIDLCRKFQLGRDLNAKKYGFSKEAVMAKDEMQQQEKAVELFEDEDQTFNAYDYAGIDLMGSTEKQKTTQTKNRSFMEKTMQNDNTKYQTKKQKETGQGKDTHSSR